jgi:hypothetical protein
LGWERKIVKVIDPIEMMANIVSSGEQSGLRWCVTLSPTKSFMNGYVQLPTDHPHHSTHYDNIPVDIHGGLTFSQNGVVGFDTGHAFDVWTEEELQKYGGRTGLPALDSDINIYWTLGMITKQTKKLADQLAKELV